MSFLERLKSLISENQVSITDIATHTGIPRSTISSYIHRKSNPSIIQLEALANYFNCTVDYLIGREDDFGNVTGAGPALSSLEEELLSVFRKLNIFERESIIIQMRALAENKASTPLKKK